MTKDLAIDPLIPAAQYVRMSDDAQQYSIANQKAAIQEYADRSHFAIVKTYQDSGKSGVIAKNRTALRQLLRDVLSGAPGYKAILVYDVSRWGRFPNSDEAAHYEFLCSSSGIPLHYCAELFKNDGTAASSILKALKRSMAAEFSRELGEKVFLGKSRIVQLGFWVGGAAGYGYRRLMISADGKRKQILNHGEHKSLATDRVILVPGPRIEIERVREMFSMAVKGYGCTAIAQHMNDTGKLKSNGRPWWCRDIWNIVTNPKYVGANVWHRGTQKLREKRSIVAPALWVKNPNAFVPIVDAETFEQAQVALPKRADTFWTDEEILRKLRLLLAAKGYLSESLIRKTPGLPATTTIHNHFGSYRELYKAVGYQLPAQDWYRGERAEQSRQLRKKLVKRLSRMFPDHVHVTNPSYSARSILEVDHSFLVGVLICLTYQRPGENRFWLVHPTSVERKNITLLCKLNPNRTRIVSYHLLPNIDIPHKSHHSYQNDPWLNRGPSLRKLSDFYSVLMRFRRKSICLWSARHRVNGPLDD